MCTIPFLQVTIMLCHGVQSLTYDHQGKIWQRPMLSSHSDAKRSSMSIFLLEVLLDEEIVPKKFQKFQKKFKVVKKLSGHVSSSL